MLWGHFLCVLFRVKIIRVGKLLIDILVRLYNCCSFLCFQCFWWRWVYEIASWEIILMIKSLFRKLINFLLLFRLTLLENLLLNLFLSEQHRLLVFIPALMRIFIVESFIHHFFLQLIVLVSIRFILRWLDEIQFEWASKWLLIIIYVIVIQFSWIKRFEIVLLFIILMNWICLNTIIGSLLLWTSCASFSKHFFNYIWIFLLNIYPAAIIKHTCGVIAYHFCFCKSLSITRIAKVSINFIFLVNLPFWIILHRSHLIIILITIWVNG